MRRILANLLCEEDLARAFGLRRREGTLPRSVRAVLSRMAPLLRVFAREGDRLWTPVPVDPEHVPDLPGLPRPVLELGPLRDLPPADAVLAWCETPEAAAHRGGARIPAALSLDAPLHELLWNLPTPEPAVVAAVHHRAFHLQVAEEIGCVLPGARMVESPAELERVVRRTSGSWIVKAPLSAAGRDRYTARSEPELSEPQARRRIERLFARHGPLLFEPWMERVDDFGVSALLAGSELRIVGIHRQEMDRRGQFAGINLEAGLFGKDQERLLEAVEAVANALRRAGYVGPFGVDAWRYRRQDGMVVLNPLGEINARMTFGLVAWTQAEPGASSDLL